MTLLTTLLLTVLAGHPPAPVTSSLAWQHTRPVAPRAAALLAQAASRSSIVRSLLYALEQTNVFVYVSHEMTVPVVEPKAYVRFVATAAGRRYLLIEINGWQTAEASCIEYLGHELQHALEIAAAPEVRDSDGLERLYRRIGYESGRRQFETLAARSTGFRIRDQLARGGD
jgi:hypothetical protein